LKRCDFQQNNNLGQIERIFFNNQLIKGDYFGLMHFVNDPSLINPLRIQVIDPERVCNPNDPKQKKAAKEKDVCEKEKR